MKKLSSHEAEERFRKGIEEFNAGCFFDAHETWEEIWLGSPEPEKTFLQGIIQVAAAYHHYTRGNRRGTKSLLEAGLKKLDEFPRRHRRIELEPLRETARRWITALCAGEDPGPAELPQVRRVSKR